MTSSRSKQSEHAAGEPGDRTADAARYIADLTTELAGMARTSELDLLAYLLDLAHLEARNRAARLSSQR